MKTEDKKIQEIVEREMENLLRYIGKKVIVHGIHDGKKFEEVRTLVDVHSYIYIATLDETVRRRIQFIGPNSGVMKIVDKETGDILYENATLNYNYPKGISSEEKLAHINNLREQKYGTDKYNATNFHIL